MSTIRPRPIRVGLILHDGAHDRADAGKRADGEEKGEADFFGEGHAAEFVEHNERDREQGKVQDDVDGAEGDADGVVIETARKGVGFRFADAGQAVHHDVVGVAHVGVDEERDGDVAG